MLGGSEKVLPILGTPLLGPAQLFLTIHQATMQQLLHIQYSTADEVRTTYQNPVPCSS